MNPRNWAELALIVSGILIIIERLFIHAISFDYASLGLAWLDPWFDHWLIGLAFVIIGAYSWWR